MSNFDSLVLKYLMSSTSLTEEAKEAQLQQAKFDAELAASVYVYGTSQSSQNEINAREYQVTQVLDEYYRVLPPPPQHDNPESTEDSYGHAQQHHYQ